MNGKVLAVLIAFGVGIGAYAFFSLSRGPAPQTEPKRKEKAQQQREPTAAAKATRPRLIPAPAEDEKRPRGPRINPPVQPQGGAAPAAPQKPQPTLDEARESFDDLMLELDREIKRGEEVGRPLSNEAWIEYYRRGNEALDPIHRQIDRAAPGAQDELNDRMEQLRTKLDDLRAPPLVQ